MYIISRRVLGVQGVGALPADEESQGCMVPGLQDFAGFRVEGFRRPASSAVKLRRLLFRGGMGQNRMKELEH